MLVSHFGLVFLILDRDISPLSNIFFLFIFLVIALKKSSEKFADVVCTWSLARSEGWSHRFVGGLG